MRVTFVAVLRQFGIEGSMGFAFSPTVYVLFFGFALLIGLRFRRKVLLLVSAVVTLVCESEPLSNRTVNIRVPS